MTEQNSFIGSLYKEIEILKLKNKVLNVGKKK